MELTAPVASRRRIGLAIRPREWVIFALAAMARLFIAYTDHGMIWGDEIYQSLEPAHRLAFGYGSLVWEFQLGARSWLFPGILAAVMKGSAALGAHTGLAVVGATKTFMVALGLLGIFAGMRIAARLGGETAAWIAGALSATFPPALVFGSRAMSETASGTILTVAALAAMQSEGAYGWLAGALAAAAIYFRYQSGLVAVCLLLLLLAQRRWKQAARYAGAATMVGLMGGALDYYTWGEAFHSFFVYWKFNFVEGNSARWGVSPWDFYFVTARSAAGPLIFFVAVGLLLAVCRAPGLLLVAAVFVAAHCRVPHKELRFLMPIIPLVLALSGVGWGPVLDRLDPRRLLGFWLSAVLAAVLLLRASRVTLGEIGQFADTPKWQELPPWNFFGGVNRALAEAGAREDVCGLTILGIPPWWMGGYSYFHRDQPLFVQDAPSLSGNYAIMEQSAPAPPGYTSIAQYREYLLLHRQGPCAPRPPGYRPPLE
jgi:phosphatidylinositol glycan class B